jgi:hypothetical protein
MGGGSTSLLRTSPALVRQRGTGLLVPTRWPWTTMLPVCYQPCGGAAVPGEGGVPVPA